MGCELYVQPKDSRLKLEVEVANENAMHWKGNLEKAHNANSALRKEVRQMATLLRRLAQVPTGLNAEEVKEIRDLVGE